MLFARTIHSKKPEKCVWNFSKVSKLDVRKREIGFYIKLTTIKSTEFISFYLTLKEAGVGQSVPFDF